MDKLGPPDSHHLRAALGWLELNNRLEARAEWNRIAGSCRRHPEVLEVEWRLCAEERDWAAALEAARHLVELAPEDPASWIHQSYSLHELKRTAEAHRQLLRVVSQFPGISTLAYNLACYACQLGRPDEARGWLERAIQLKGKEAIKATALADPDLAPMRGEIERL